MAALSYVETRPTKASRSATLRIKWRFNAWAKYPNYAATTKIGSPDGEGCARACRNPRRRGATSASSSKAAASTSTAQGTLLTTEECLLSKVQQRNPGISPRGLRAGVRRLSRDCEGHLARPRDRRRRHPRPRRRHRALRRARHGRHRGRVRSRAMRTTRPCRKICGACDRRPTRTASTQDGRATHAGARVIRGPPAARQLRQLLHREWRWCWCLSSTIPTTAVASNILADLFPDREIVRIYCGDLIWGFGALHCMTQQQPAFGI